MKCHRPEDIIIAAARPFEISVKFLLTKKCPGANLKGFRASMNPTFEDGILDFMDGIPNSMENLLWKMRI